MVDEQNRPSVLVVDDSPENIDILKALLSSEYKVRAANRGLRALELAQGPNPPDLILLDVTMPDLNGYEVCSRLKADPRSAAIPVIFVTARREVSDEARGFESGAVDFISKPIRPPVVLARVRTHLRLRQIQTELEAQKSALEEAARLRDDVERITRHDLKGPLNNIIAVPRYLVTAYDFTPVDRELLLGVERSGHKMLNLINRSLDLYKMETGTYTFIPQAFDLVPVLLSTLEELALSPLLDKRRWRLLLDGAPWRAGMEFWVMGEEMLCYPMFSNLLLNAFEASPQGGEVVLALQNQGTEVSVSITNPGAVPEALKAVLFDKYVTSGKSSGTGLGAYSAKLCAETQRGSIAVTTPGGSHTCIEVRLPKTATITLEELQAQFAPSPREA